jgi:O-antigen ligase
VHSELALDGTLAGRVALTPLASQPGERFSWPEAATLAVVALLYSNAAVVAVRFHGLPFAVGAMVVLPLAVPLANDLILHRRPLIVTPALPFVLLFLAMETVTVAMSRDPETALSRLFEEGQGVVLYILITNVVRNAATLRRIVWSLILVGSILGAIALHQQLTGSFRSTYGGFAQADTGAFDVQTSQGTVSQPRLAGPIGETNRYAQIMLMLMPLGFMQFAGGRSWWARTLAILGTALAAVGCALTFSRGAALALVLVVGTMAMMGYIRPRHLVVLVLGSFLALTAFPQSRARLASLQTVADSLLAGQAGGQSGERLDGAVTGRLTEMLAAARVFADHPVFGVGPGMFKYYAPEYGNDGGLRFLEGPREAHNLYLGIAAETGALGILSFLAIVFVTLRSLQRRRQACMRTDPALAHSVTGFILVVVAYLATGMSMHFSYTRYFWLMLGLAGAAGSMHGGSTQVPR